MAEYLARHRATPNTSGLELSSQIAALRSVLRETVQVTPKGRKQTSSIDVPGGGKHTEGRVTSISLLYGEEADSQFAKTVSEASGRAVNEFGYVQAHWVDEEGGHTQNSAYFIGDAIYVPNWSHGTLLRAANNQELEQIHDRLLVPLVGQVALARS